MTEPYGTAVVNEVGNEEAVEQPEQSERQGSAPQVVAVMNPAGSSAKSSTVAAIAAELASQGRRVLVVGLDPQGNVTTWFGVRRDSAGISQAIQSASVAWPGVSPEEVQAELQRQVRRTIQHTSSGVDLIVEDLQLQHTIAVWATFDRPEYLLADVLASVQDDYDAILIDCKGDMGVLTLAAMQAVRPDDPAGRKVQAVCVCLPDVKSIGGLARVRAEVERLAGEGDQVELAAVIPVKIQHRNASAVADDLYQELKQDPTVAPKLTPPVRKVATLDEAYMRGEPVTIWDPTWKVSEDYRAVVEHLRNRKVLP